MRQANDMDKRSSSEGPARRASKKRRLLLWLLLIPGILILTAGSLYGYYLVRYYSDVSVDQDYVDDWSDLTAESVTGSTAEPAESSVTTTVPPSPSPSETSGTSDPSETQGTTTTPSTAAPTPTPTLTPTPVETIPGKPSGAKWKSDPIVRISPIDPDVENILLIGVDGGDGQNIGHRSDTMIVLSIDKGSGTARLISFMRDILVYYPAKDKWDKLNASYAYGGPGQTVNMINYNFELDIQKYIVVDFAGFRKIVDIMGGVTITITEAESHYISGIAGISGAGTYRLTGDQALEYSRIRQIDSDFRRAKRQRTVLRELFSEFRAESPATQLEAANEMFGYARSNLDPNDILGRLLTLATTVDTTIGQRTIPEEGMYTVNSETTWYMELDWEAQKASLHKYIYG